MKRITGLTFSIAFCALLSGCATRTTVMAGLSENIKDYYSIYPSVEIDVVAVTAEEAEDLKKINADNYFSVGNAMRESLSPYTFMFSAEQTAPLTMKYNVPQWDKWLEKDPEKIAVLANMPRKADENAKGKDPRVLILDISTGFMHHKTVYVEANPGSVVRIYKEPADPEKVAERKRKEAEKIRRKEAEKKAKERKAAEEKAEKERRAAEKKAAKERKAAEKNAVKEKNAAAKETAGEAKPAGKKSAPAKKSATVKKSAGKKASASAAKKTTPNQIKG